MDSLTFERPSQSAEDASRDGVVPALAELSVSDRVSVVVSESTPDGVWAISEVPGTTEAPDCVIGNREGRYGTDFHCVAEYREVLLLTDDLSRIIRAYPLPGGIHLIGDPAFSAGGTLEFIGLAGRAAVGIEIRQDDEMVVDVFAETTDRAEAWGLFRNRAVGLNPEQHVTVTISQDTGPEPATVTFEYQSGLDTSQPTDQQLIDQSDLDVTDALMGFARGEVPFEELSLAAEVMLGLGNTELVTVDRSDLSSASAWITEHEEFAESTGPFDIIGPLRTEAGITQVNAGPRPHCAGPALDFGPEWGQGRHLVIEPTGMDTCLEWYAIHLLVNDRGQIQAVNLDLFGP